VKDRVLFVDDEPNVLDGIRRQLRNRVDLETATSGAAGLQLIRARGPFAVVVSDMRMPGMDGAAVLEKARGLQPRAARIVLSGQTDREAALRTAFAAHQFLAKPCDIKTLRGVVERMCSLATWVGDEPLRVLASAVGALPLSPAGRVAARRLVTDRSLSSAEAARLVESDPALSAKLLQLVSSALFSLPRRMTNVHEAVTLIGTLMLRDLVLAWEEQNQAHRSPVPDVTLQDVQRRSLHTALIAKAIAESFGHDAHDAFTAGLLHDVSLLLLSEDRVPPCGRAVLSGYLLGLWGLAERVVEAVAHQQDASVASFNPEAGPDLVHILGWAKALAQPFSQLQDREAHDEALPGLSDDQKVRFRATARQLEQTREPAGLAP